MRIALGIDVGGTFTDVVLLRDNQIVTAKAETTHYDLKLGVFNAIRLAAEQIDTELEALLAETAAVVYSTTVGTNALIERRGTRLGLITTHGFEDAIMVGRSANWADGLPPQAKYDRGRGRRPTPIIPRENIVGALERIDNLGQVLMPLNEAHLREKVQQLVDLGVRGIVVVTLNSFVNPAHERRIAEIIRTDYPECYLGHLPVYLSCDISPQMDEYRRAMTVILDAYLREVSEEHLLRMVEELRVSGYRRPVFISKNTGGISSLSRTQALHLYGSGPAAAVMGAAYLRGLTGCESAVVADMGGTSFDVGLVGAGQETRYDQNPIIDRFRVQVPIVPHWSIGAGGGSIARLENGVLKVGPQSAGSNPGPACYAMGGEHPTVTDADVVLGFIDPDYFLGGAFHLDADRAREAIESKVAVPLGITVEQAAWDIKQLIDGVMGQEIYRLAVYRSGQDPRSLAMFAFGGAGPVHATGLAEFAGIRRILTFPFSSVFGAFSTLTLDIFQSYEKTLVMTLYSQEEAGDLVDRIERINHELSSLTELARRDMSEEGFDMELVQLKAEALLCYRNQRQTIQVPMPALTLTGRDDVQALCEAFNTAYAARYGQGAVFKEVGIELLGLRLIASVPTDKPVVSIRLPRDSGKSWNKGSRRVFWGPAAGIIDTPVYDREALSEGDSLAGPTLCEGKDTVLVVPSGWALRIAAGNLAWVEKLDDHASGAEVRAGVGGQ
ncbi:MAG TPA: hydantoinase/oxoprolinase family protein [Candidatus Binataceae bacterium]|nr:hydantoinase/oxoprolinase family protein [Candidatus Binataceae bacterium]